MPDTNKFKVKYCMPRKDWICPKCGWFDGDKSCIRIDSRNDPETGECTTVTNCAAFASAEDFPKPMFDAPRDGTPILAYHWFWKCWICIRYRVIDKKENYGLAEEWVDCTHKINFRERWFQCWIDHPKEP